MSLNGIDTSSYQTGLDAADIAGDFVIVKATEGTNYINPVLSGHAKQTLASGKKLGVYHFASVGDATKQADYFLYKVGNYVGKSMLVLDYEAKAVSQGVEWAKTWLDHVYAKTGVRPIIYMGLADENRLDWSPVVKANYGLWVAQYNNYNQVVGYKPRNLYGSLKHWKSAAMFQYTSAGRLAGWSGDLDFDVFYGDKSDWDKYAKASKRVAASKPATNSSAPKWVKESKTYTLKTAVKLRKSTSTSADVIATLKAGETVKTDAAIITGGYRWVRQLRSGGYGYLATGPVGDTLAYVKTGVAHTSYTVVSGDSLWAIAQRYSTTVGNLCKLNGITQNHVIHPGNKLMVK
ncbi:lysin [Lactiplantibacillus fabifermentans T30PCM01]|uniref:Lysin n=1 Tax=Lactiplantibacillus fabifermentans T30PCM01 TaxID=1400520 RepID=W6T8T2_9LACO|nr:GH25 family lysozyme [Lactiplantibacillus fabifermentans]ETY74767.1 lysin [Lactiplantibacillus fabifermentans T30PCM01]